MTLYAKLVEYFPSATSADLEALCTIHPDLAAELHALHQTRRLLEALGRGASCTAHDRAGTPKPMS